MAKVRLGDIATVVTKGTTPTTMGFQFEDGGINFVKIESISEDGTFLKEKFSHISDECNVQMRRSQLQENDILFSIAGAIGRSAIVTKEILPANTNQALAIIRVPKGKIDYNYLLYALSSSAINQQATQHQQGVAQLNISLKNVSDFLLPIYTEAMQKRIVHNLKKIDKLISLRKQQLAKLDELVKARFVEMFGEPVQNPNCWKTENLLDLGYCKNGMNFHRDDCGTEIHCLGVGDFKNHSTIRDVGSLPFISLNELPTSEYLLQDGDIVFVRSNGNKELVGRCLAIYPAKIPVTYSGFCIRYRLTSNKITVSYLLRVLKADSVRKKMTGRGANIQNLNQQILAQLVVPIPPLSLQNQFAAFVERVDQQKQTVQQGLEKLELMKKALMQEYFG